MNLYQCLASSEAIPYNIVKICQLLKLSLCALNYEECGINIFLLQLSRLRTSFTKQLSKNLGLSSFLIKSKIFHETGSRLLEMN